MREITDINELLEIVKAAQGEQTQKLFAESLKASPQYISDVYSNRTPPGPRILEGLGISTRTTYFVPDELVQLAEKRKRKWRK